MSYYLFWLLLLAVFVVSVVAQSLNTRHKIPKGAKGTPPGPPALPLIGNLLDIPPFHSWLKFKAWSDVYGPIFRFKIIGSSHVVLSTEKVANDLLRERGNIYSSRDQLQMAAKLVSRDLQILLMPYDERWRRARKMVASFTSISVAPAYQPLQTKESIRLLYDLVRHPSKYETWFERYAGSVVMRLSYGRSVDSQDDPYVHRAAKVAHDIERVASPGAYLVDTIPALKYLPSWLAPFKREADALFNEHMGLFRELQENVRREMKLGTAPESFTRTFLEKREEFAMSDDEGAYLIGTLFGAGTGTTAATMMSFCLAMCHHPGIQKELQAEVDREVSQDRLPMFEDMSRLPMVRAVVKETLRWRPVTAGGVPHQLSKDDVYEGYFLHKGTNIHPNQWAIHRDETLYPDPETFNPHRWLSPKYPTYREPLDQFPNLQSFSAFGFGRRICPGLHIAERSLNLLVARIASVCSIQKKPGVEVPLYDYSHGFNTQPNHFDFDLLVRNHARWGVVQKEHESIR